jgi:hypothetical protein
MTQDKAAIISHWIAVINEEGRGLTKWETDFMYSITEQWEEKGWMSNRQVEILERIYGNRT